MAGVPAELEEDDGQGRKVGQEKQAEGRQQERRWTGVVGSIGEDSEE